MAIVRTGVRLTAAEQISLRKMWRPLAGKTWADFRGRLLTLDFKGPNGEQLRASEVVAAGTKRIAKILTVAASRVSQVELPEMIDIPGMTNKRIMRGELTVGLFKQVMQGIKIAGHYPDKLEALLADDSEAGAALTYVSLLDAREFAKRLSDLTGRKFRVQTEAEWKAAGGQLSGSNWTWTETPHPDYPGAFVLRHLCSVNHISNFPGVRYNIHAVRLVEDL